MCRLRTGPAASQPRGLDQTVQRGRFGSPPGPRTVHSVAAPFCARAYTASFISAIFTVARSQLSFTANLRKKNSAKYRKKCCIVNYFVNTKFKTQKVDFLSKLPMKKLKIV